MFEEYNKQEEAEQKASFIADAMQRFPDNPEIWKWWETQKFQKEQGEQEYMMIYEIDLPKILKAFTEHFLNVVGQSEQLVCDNHHADLEHFMNYSESICKTCKQKV